MPVVPSSTLSLLAIDRTKKKAVSGGNAMKAIGLPDDKISSKPHTNTTFHSSRTEFRAIHTGTAFMSTSDWKGQCKWWWLLVLVLFLLYFSTCTGVPMPAGDGIILNEHVHFSSFCCVHHPSILAFHPPIHPCLFCRSTTRTCRVYRSTVWISFL